MTSRPNPSHKWVPAYAVLNMKENTLICLECSESIESCNCIWAAIRDLQKKTEDNWERIYKRDEAFGKRIIAIEEYIGKMIIDKREINSDYELHCNAILKLEDDVKKLNEAISMENLEDKQTINTFEEKYKVQRDCLNQRVNKIEEQLKLYCLSDHDERIHDLEKIEAEPRLIRLESENNMRQDTIACVDSAYDDACKKIDERLDKLEECIKRITEDDMKVFKKPFICPACNGYGKIPDLSNMAHQICYPCNGEGIVWG